MIKAIPLGFLLSFFFLGFSIEAQTKKNSHLKRYFNDPVGNKKNLVKTDFIALSRGELSLHYERILSPKLSIELQYGHIFSYQLARLDNFIALEKPLDEDEASGFSYGIQIRNYFTGLSPERYYTTLSYRYRKLEEHGQGLMDLTGGIGIQNYLNSFFLWDLALMSGTRLHSNNTEENPKGKGIPLIYLQAKIAYLF